MSALAKLIVIIRGGGEIASGIAYYLHLSHIRVCLTETTAPLAIARGVTFCEAVFDGTKTIMGVTAELVNTEAAKIHGVWQRGNIPLIIDPDVLIKKEIKPDVLIDAIMAKRNVGTNISDAQLVIGVGPGFYAGRDVNVVVESNNGKNTGNVIFEG